MKGFAVIGMNTGLPSVMFTFAMILSIIVISTNRSEMIPRTRSVPFVGIFPFTAIYKILQNSASSLDLTAFRRTNAGSHSVSPVVVFYVHYTLSDSVGTCVSKHTVVLSLLNGMNASSSWIPNRCVVSKGSSETGVPVIQIWLGLYNE